MGALMRQHDWSGSPLGAPANWPPSLGAVVALLLNSKFPMFVAWGPELAFIYNDAYAEILGSKHPDALGRPFQKIWAEIWDDLIPSIDSALAGTASFHENLPLKMRRRGFDEQTWFTFSYSPARGEDGKVEGIFCACTETTGQVLAERHRDIELDRLRQLFQQAPGIIAYLREPGHIFELANDSYQKLVGQRDLVGRKVRDALPEISGQGFLELLDRVSESGEPYVGHAVPVMLQRQPGAPLEQRFVNFIYQPTRDHWGNVSGIFVEGSDVTEAVQATEALRDSELRLRQLANTIPQMAWMADAAGSVHWFNDRWYDYTGTSFEQVCGSGWISVVHPEDLPNLKQKWKAALTTGALYEVTARFRGASGEYRTFFINAAPLHDASGQLVQWFGTDTDVTPIETAQNELKAANRRKDEFLAMLAHELRNPLAPISTAAQLLKLAGLDENRVRQTSEIISRQVGHMTNLVDDLLDVSRVTRNQVSLHEEMLDLGSLVSDAVEQVQSLLESKQHQLSVDAPGEHLFVLGDRTRLIQVFSNLLNNAAKYTPANGHIALCVRAADDFAEVSVQDDGAGIASSLLPHVFDLFTQAERSPDRAQGGLGLGLALVKSLVGLHGGEVAAYSEGPGKGSRFVVRLRRQPAPLDAPSGAQIGMPSAPQALSQKMILVVDDNIDAANMLSLLLETAGHQVRIAHNATDALQAARQDRPTILFIDIGLPDMDGYQLARRLRAQPETASALLVAVTGYGQPADRQQALDAGFDHHLVKPVDLDDVLALLK